MKLTRYKINGFDVLAVPVLDDNFVFLISRDGKAVLIDAGEAKPIFQTLEKENLQLLDILITHAEYDHVSGCRALCDQLGVQATSPGVESGEFPVIETLCRSISTPGHMPVHKVYHFPELGILFAGDALINGGCGKVRGGMTAQFFNSLQLIKQLPDETRIFGGHDYLAENMAFALSVEPDNADIQARLNLYRENPAAALFTTLAEEKKTNPFLRASTVEEFTALRKQKDSF